MLVINAQTRNPNRPSLKYSSGGSGPLIKDDEAFCLATSNGGGNIYYAILREKRPGQFLLENVKGLLSHDDGKTFRTIVTTLAEMGYCVEWEVLNSKNFGVPQNRERVFIHGFREGCGRQIFPLGSADCEADIGAQGRPDVAAIRVNHGVAEQTKDEPLCLDKSYHKGFDNHGQRTGVLQSLTDKGFNDILSAKGDHYASAQERNAVKILFRMWEEIGEEAFAKWGLGVLNSLQSPEVLQHDMHGDCFRQEAGKKESEVDDGSLSCEENLSKRSLQYLWERKSDRCSPQEQGLERQFIEELTETMQKLSQQMPSFRIRRLTPVETERLQGFPDDWTKYGADGKVMSDSARYKACGNAVTTNVIRAVIEEIYNTEV